MIHCSRCDQDLDVEAFAPTHRQDGDWCRPCRKAYMADYWWRTGRGPLHGPAVPRPRAEPCHWCGVEVPGKRKRPALCTTCRTEFRVKPQAMARELFSSWAWVQFMRTGEVPREYADGIDAWLATRPGLDFLRTPG